MLCPVCHAHTPDDSHFCAGCGADLKTIPICKSCGVALSVGARFCSACGNGLVESRKSIATFFAEDNIVLRLFFTLFPNMKTIAAMPRGEFWKLNLVAFLVMLTVGTLYVIAADAMFGLKWMQATYTIVVFAIYLRVAGHSVHGRLMSIGILSTAQRFWFEMVMAVLLIVSGFFDIEQFMSSISVLLLLVLGVFPSRLVPSEISAQLEQQESTRRDQ